MLLNTGVGRSDLDELETSVKKMALDVPDCCENALRGFLFEIGCEPGTNALLLMSPSILGECNFCVFGIFAMLVACDFRFIHCGQRFLP